MRTRRPSPAFALALLAAAPLASIAQPCDPATLFGPNSVAINTTAPREVRVADMNGDGLVDLITADSNLGKVSVAIAAFPGVFDPPTAYATGGGFAWDVRLADLDGDGDTDAVVIDVTNDAFIPMLNDGSGALTAQPSSPMVSTNVLFFTLADVDNDGDADILGSSVDAGTIDVFLNAGNGTFGPASVQPGSPGQDIVTGDMNGDGNLDAIVTDFRGDGIGVMLGNGDGTFQPTITSPVVVPGGEAPTGIDVADFDGDGLLDVATGLNSGEVAVLFGTGGGVLGPATAYDIGGAILIDLYVADLDGDDDADIAAQNPVTDTITLLINNGAGVFDDSAVVTGAVSSAFTIADVDGDFDPDLLMPETSTNQISLRLNQCGPFGPVITSQPQSVLRSLGDPAAVFEVEALAAVAYQWRLDGVDLADDAVFTGTQTDTLVVAAGSGIEGLLDVVVSDGVDPAKDIASQPAVLAVRNDCPADQNFDGQLTPGDFNAWVLNYNLGCP